jgi:hypothetical protein
MKFSKKENVKKRLSLEDFKAKNQNLNTEKALARIVGGALSACHPA